MNKVIFLIKCRQYIKNETKKKSFVKTFNRENVRLKLKQNINC